MVSTRCHCLTCIVGSHHIMKSTGDLLKAVCEGG